MYTYKRRLHDVRYQANKTADNFFTKINIIANTANKQKMPYGLKCAMPATNGLKLRLNCIIYLPTRKRPTRMRSVHTAAILQRPPLTSPNQSAPMTH